MTGRMPFALHMCKRRPHHARGPVPRSRVNQGGPAWLMVQYSRHSVGLCAGFPPPGPLSNLHAEVEHDDGVTGIHDRAPRTTLPNASRFPATKPAQDSPLPMVRAVPDQPSPKRGERSLVNVATAGLLLSTGDVTPPSDVGRKAQIGCAGLGRPSRRRPNRSSSTRTSSSKVLRHPSPPADSYRRRPVGTRRPLYALRRARLNVAVLDLVKATRDQPDGRPRHPPLHCGPSRSELQVCGSESCSTRRGRPFRIAMRPRVRKSIPRFLSHIVLTPPQHPCHQSQMVAILDRALSIMSGGG
jgi:hypothetical protein